MAKIEPVCPDNFFLRHHLGNYFKNIRRICYGVFQSFSFWSFCKHCVIPWEAFKSAKWRVFWFLRSGRTTLLSFISTAILEIGLHGHVLSTMHKSYSIWNDTSLFLAENFPYRNWPGQTPGKFAYRRYKQIKFQARFFESQKTDSI